MNPRQKAFREALGELRAHPLITLGFSLFWTWVWLVVQSSFLNAEGFLKAIPIMSKWVIPLAAYGITFLVLGLLYRLKRFMPQSTGYLVSFSIVTTFGVLTCAIFSYYPTSDTTVTVTLLIIGALIMGAGTSCLHMEWGRLLGRLGPRKTIIHGASGTFGAALLIFFVSRLPDEFAWLILALLPLCCVITIILQRRKFSAGEMANEQAQLIIPWRFLCTSFIQGTAFGILQAILPITEGATVTTSISGLGSLIGALALFLVVFLFRLDFNQLMYHVGFVILAASFMLMAAAGSLFTGGWLLNVIGYRFIDVLMWALCVYLVKQRDLPTNWVFAITTGALLIGQVFGALVGFFAHNVFGGQQGDLEILSVFMVFVILAGALFMSSKNNLQKGWGMIRPGSGDESGDDFRVACALVTDGFELTPREFEIFELLAQGHNKAYISERLFLSKETVKTHTRNLYHKMSLHSQKDLIALTSKQLHEEQISKRWQR
ncbi:MAG: LuxR C-terminal-related transcriptional regulator [Coriobacteriales bacterium]|jgi:DNA-binding CsgD family transcriptional regulator|nr:LuxR C-terminal-related transcriptional regulator [Coriobacteriales bacterium]